MAPGVVAMLGLLLGLLLLGAHPGSGQSVIALNALEGGSILLTPRFEGSPEGFVWRKGLDKICEQDPPEPVIYYDLKDRSEINHTTLALTIKRLQLSDSGRYKSEVLINGDYKPTDWDLRVFPFLGQPEVSCNITEGRRTVWCGLHPEPSPPPTFLWKKDKVPINVSDYPDYSVSPDKKTLTLKDEGTSVQGLECAVGNAAMENLTAVPPDCFPEDQLLRGRHRIIALSVFSVFLVLLVLACIYGLWKWCCPSGLWKWCSPSGLWKWCCPSGLWKRCCPSDESVNQQQDMEEENPGGSPQQQEEEEEDTGQASEMNSSSPKQQQKEEENSESVALLADVSDSQFSENTDNRNHSSLPPEEHRNSLVS